MADVHVDIVFEGVFGISEVSVGYFRRISGLQHVAGVEG